MRLNKPGEGRGSHGRPRLKAKEEVITTGSENEAEMFAKC